MEGTAHSRVLITGASRGIGRAVAERLAGPGRRLLLHGRDREALEAVCRAVRTAGGEAEALLADLADPDAVEALARAAAAAPLDGLVNNAGVAAVSPLEETTLEAWRHAFAVNVTAPFLLVRGVLGAMPRGAFVVNVLSVAARRGFPGWGAYCMTKAALDGFARALREEVRPRGLRVVSIYPGATATGMWRELPGEWPRERMLTPAEVAEAVAYAVERPGEVLVEEVTLGHASGAL